MKKTILKDWGNLVVEDAPIPELGEDEVLIKLIYGGFCGTDAHVFRHKHASATIPRVLGHEYCGEIAAINTNKPTNLKIGDFVTSHPLNACGVCDPCLSGSENACKHLEIYGVHIDGCFVEYFKVPISKVCKIDKSVDPQVAALIEPLTVALHDIRVSGFRGGQSVFIISAGPIGLAIAEVVRHYGASKVVLSEMNQYRIDLAKSLGFEVVNPTEDGVEKKLMDMTGGKGFEMIYEASGSRAGTALMTKVAANCSTMVVVGVPTDVYPVDTGAMLAKELKLVGVRIHSQLDFQKAVELVNSGVLNDNLKKMVTHVFSLQDIAEAMDFNIKDQAHFKILLKP